MLQLIFEGGNCSHISMTMTSTTKSILILLHVCINHLFNSHDLMAIEDNDRYFNLFI